MSSLRLFAILSIAAAQPFLIGCGPSLAQINPSNVVNVAVRPASGELTYCPGNNFTVELVTKLKDGSTCSSLDPNRGCMGEKNTIISPELLQLSGSSGKGGVSRDGTLYWSPDPDPLKTADTGIRLRGWLEGAINGKPAKSPEGEIDLKPVYDCDKEHDFTPKRTGAHNGANGMAGQTVAIAITTFSTPFYPDAALIRLDWNAQRTYMISPSADKPVRIIVGGQSGAVGVPGNPGTAGTPGQAATAECKNGTDGTDGTAGTVGQKGGNGGVGGTIKVILDDTNADKLRGRLLLAAPGGQAGPGGPGGPGGKGGQGGAAGPKPAQNPPADCNPIPGQNGRDGAPGAPGPSGAAGADGPAPVFEMGKRQVVWANELNTIQRIEGAGGRAK